MMKLCSQSAWNTRNMQNESERIEIHLLFDGGRLPDDTIAFLERWVYALTDIFRYRYFLCR